MARLAILLAPDGFTWATYDSTQRPGWVRVRVHESGDWPYPTAVARRDVRVIKNTVMGVTKARDHYRRRHQAGWRAP